MCTLTHFAQPFAPLQVSGSPTIRQAELHSRSPEIPRFQVILAGNSFFHIKEISTGHVRGFRVDHNEACALARALEATH
ncbi:hypothetical protein K9857_13185 [Pseudomonas sp. REP124]|uniref:hypothetical protein n=1 Tax=Pseudomonas sp. REP124 TaxID=2875731 RepID=UPI001CCD9627|nr:hypothetical protein [Pseudomonas sp. REP124]MBZ9782491.1 hypothetical protein [Pseudomonas sp. REP124]